MSIVFYNKKFEYSDKIPLVNENDIKIFSSRLNKKQMYEIMKHHGVELQEIGKIMKKELSKIFTQYSFLRSREDWGIITDVARK